MICKILSFRSTKSTDYAITSFIFVFCEGITPVVIRCFHFAYVRFGNTKDVFLDTLNARHNKLSIGFAWSGSIFQMKPSKLPTSWKIYLENHQRFFASRKVLLLSHLEPENTFSLGVKCLDENTRVPKEMLNEIKHRWCNCPDEL